MWRTSAAPAGHVDSGPSAQVQASNWSLLAAAVAPRPAMETLMGSGGRTVSSPRSQHLAVPWRIHFFQRHAADDPDRKVPAIDFMDRLPPKVAAEIHAVLDAVAAAPPPSFSGGGKWEAMGGEMAGYFEVRVRGGGRNHRLFCILERNASDLGGSSIVCIDGLSKPPRSPAHPRDYSQAKGYGAEFKKRRTVLM